MNEKKNIQETKLGILIAFIFIICSFIYFQYIVPYHIFFKEQIQLFVFNSTFLLSYFEKPGWLACLTGDFLTQFLYLEGGGAVLITLLLVIEWILSFRILKAFSLNTFTSLWALFPVIVEWIGYSDIYFSIAMSIAFILSMLCFCIYTNIRSKVLSIMFGMLLIPLLYISIGSTMFLFLFLVLIYEFHLSKRRFIYWLGLIIIAILIPYCMRSSYLLTLWQAYFYPFYSIKQEISLWVLVLIVFLSSLKFIRNIRITFGYFISIIILIIVISVGGLIKTTNIKQEKILGMSIEAYFENWKKTLSIAEKTKIQDAIATYYTNIALSKQMQLGDRMMEFYQPFSSGLFLPVGPDSNWFTIFFGSDVYFYIGDMNMAQHSAMLGTIFSPYQRSSRLIQRLVEINIVTGDIPAAMKYIRIMESTLFHKKRAAVLKDMALNPDNYPELIDKRNKIHKDDILHISSNQQSSLELLIKNNPDNMAALDYLLCFYLLNKDIPSFFNLYSSYFKSRTNHVPVIYSQALLIYFATIKAKQEVVSEYGINPELIKLFSEYTNIYEKTGGDLKQMQEKFSNTYWLYYHFATLKK